MRNNRLHPIALLYVFQKSHAFIPRMLLIPLLLTPLLWGKSHAPHITQEKIGQQYYLHACGSCHGSGKLGGNMATVLEWKGLLANHAKELIELHEDENGTAGIIAYLKSDRFTKEHDHLLKFLQEFANDSESIPTCY